MRIDDYNAYYATLRTIDTARIERVLSNDKESTTQLLASTPTICHAFIFETKGKALWKSGERRAAIDAVKQAFNLHPLPVGVAFLLAKWSISVGEYVDAFLFADLTIEFDFMRNDIAFVDAARGLKVMAL